MVVPGDLSWTNEAVELVCNGSAERTNKMVGLRHAIHDGVGVVKSRAHQSVSNQSGGVGIEDGTNVAKSSDVVLTGLA